MTKPKYHYQYILWRQTKPAIFLWVHHLIIAEFLLIRKKKQCEVRGYVFVCSKALQNGFSSCPSGPVVKIDTFSACMRKAKCLHALATWWETQTLPYLWLWTWLTCWVCCQSWSWSHPEIREFFSYQNDQSEAYDLLHLRNHCWTHSTLFLPFALSSDQQSKTGRFSNHLHRHQIDSQILRFSCWIFERECQRYKISFPNL